MLLVLLPLRRKKKISDKRKASMKAKKKVGKTEKKAAKGGKCFHCGKEGYWKTNYKEFLNTVKPKECIVLVLETSLVEKSNNVCTSLQGLQVQKVA